MARGIDRRRFLAGAGATAAGALILPSSARGLVQARRRTLATVLDPAGTTLEATVVPTGAGPFIAAHLKSLQDYPPSQAADTLSMKKALEETMKKLENPRGGNN